MVTKRLFTSIFANMYVNVSLKGKALFFTMYLIYSETCDLRPSMGPQKWSYMTGGLS